VRRSLPALVAGPLVVVAMLGALGFASGAAQPPTLGQRAMPASGPPGVLPNLVLDGAAPRPATAYSLRSLDGNGTMGSAEVEWTPQGDVECAGAAVPLGASGTEVAIRLRGDQAFTGRITGRLYAPHPACDRAVGIWRGTDGSYEGRDGGLEVALERDGAVRMVLSP
jgi:hypothetical protein